MILKIVLCQTINLIQTRRGRCDILFWLIQNISFLWAREVIEVEVIDAEVIEAVVIEGGSYRGRRLLREEVIEGGGYRGRKLLREEFIEVEFIEGGSY